MTTKRPSKKQVIILISSKNKARFIEFSSKHIANLNRALKTIKSDVMANIRNNHIFNNITIASRLRIIKVSLKSDMVIIWLDI